MDKNKLKVIISTISFGMIGTVSRFIPLSSTVLVFYRAIIASLFVYLYVLITKKPFRIKVIKDNIFMLVVAGLSICFNWTFMFMAFNFCSVPVATVALNTMPIFILLIASIFFDEKISKKSIFCIILSTIGIIFISNVLISGFKKEEIIGVIYGILGALFTAITVMANKKLVKVNTYEKTIFEFMFAAIVMFLFVIIKKESFLFTNTDNLPLSIIMFIVMCIYITGIVYIMYYSIINILPSKTLAFVSYFDPVTSLTLSYLVLNEKLVGIQIVGAILILLSSIINEFLPERKSKFFIKK